MNPCFYVAFVFICQSGAQEVPSGQPSKYKLPEEDQPAGEATRTSQDQQAQKPKSGPTIISYYGVYGDPSDLEQTWAQDFENEKKIHPKYMPIGGPMVALGGVYRKPSDAFKLDAQQRADPDHPIYKWFRRENMEDHERIANQDPNRPLKQIEVIKYSGGRFGVTPPPEWHGEANVGASHGKHWLWQKGSRRFPNLNMINGTWYKYKPIGTDDFYNPDEGAFGEEPPLDDKRRDGWGDHFDDQGRLVGSQPLAGPGEYVEYPNDPSDPTKMEDPNQMKTTNPFPAEESMVRFEWVDELEWDLESYSMSHSAYSRFEGSRIPPPFRKARHIATATKDLDRISPVGIEVKAHKRPSNRTAVDFCRDIENVNMIAAKEMTEVEKDDDGVPTAIYVLPPEELNFALFGTLTFHIRNKTFVCKDMRLGAGELKSQEQLALWEKRDELSKEEEYFRKIDGGGELGPLGEAYAKGTLNSEGQMVDGIENWWIGGPHCEGSAQDPAEYSIVVLHCDCGIAIMSTKKWDTFKVVVPQYTFTPTKPPRWRTIVDKNFGGIVGEYEDTSSDEDEKIDQRSPRTRKRDDQAEDEKYAIPWDELLRDKTFDGPPTGFPQEVGEAVMGAEMNQRDHIQRVLHPPRRPLPEDNRFKAARLANEQAARDGGLVVHPDLAAQNVKRSIFKTNGIFCILCIISMGAGVFAVYVMSRLTLPVQDSMMITMV